LFAQNIGTENVTNHKATTITRKFGNYGFFQIAQVVIGQRTQVIRRLLLEQEVWC